MDGIIVIDKESDYTSFDVVAIVRGILREKKIGHSGTLDPMATGVLPILVGAAAKAQSLLPDTDKEYEADFRLGMTTDTLDITGRVLSECECDIKREDIDSILPSFRGDIMQIPPMYSAVQKNGVRLYDLARQGIEVEREARPVTVTRLELMEFDESAKCGRFIISCSKGTYIRVICDDIGKLLGCGCVMTALRRTSACGYTVNDAIKLSELQKYKDEGRTEEILRPVDSIFNCYDKLIVSDKQAVRFSNGASLSLERLKKTADCPDGTILRVYGNKAFIGLGIIDRSAGELKLKKNFFRK